MVDGGPAPPGGLLHSAAASGFHWPSWYLETSMIDPSAGRTASHRGQRNLYRLMCRAAAELHRTRRAVPQTHFTSVRRIDCFKRLKFNLSLGTGIAPKAPST